MDKRLILIVIMIFIFIALLSTYSNINENYCNSDEECIPAQCCHPTSCTNIRNKPNCSDIFCTQVCEGPIDCGAGSCKCVNNKCQVVPKL